MCRPLKYFFLLAICLVCIRGKAQLYWETIDNYSTRNGLPNNLVLSVFQDSRGFIWVGTDNGLCRYDGREFKVLEDFSDRDRPWNNSVTVIKEDANGDIWIGTRSGILARWDEKTKKWAHATLNAETIFSLFFEPSGQGWVGTKKGNLYKIKNDTTVVLVNTANTITNIIPLETNRLLLVGQFPGVFNIKSGRGEKLQLPGAPSSVFVEGAAASREHFFYFLKDKIISIGMHDSQRHEIAISFPVLQSVPGILKNGNLLLVIGENLYEVTPQGSILYKLHLDENSATLKGNSVNTVFEDNTGLIWIGTNAGLFKIDKKKIQFKKYTANTIKPRIKYNYVRALHAAQNQLWVGAKEGQIGRVIIDTISGESLQSHWYSLRLRNGELDSAYTINVVLVDKQGTAWAGGTEGLCRMKKNESVFSIVHTAPGSSPIWALFFDDVGHLLVGNAAGLQVLDDNLGAKSCEINGKPVDFAVWNIVKTHNGQLWACTQKGIYKLKWDKNKSIYILYDDFSGASGVGTVNVWGMAQDKEGNMWVASTENGVTVMDEKNKKFTRYTTKEGLASNMASYITADSGGNMWIGTVKGLSEYEQKSGRFINFTEDDGLLNNDLNFKACAFSAWGQLFLGTKVGITAFYPSSILHDTVLNAPVEITAVRVKSAEYPFYYKNPVITLDYNKNDISFRFAVLDYSKEFSHRYKFMLRGFEDKWQEATFDNPTAVYTNLSPGTYTFIVMASADGRVWSSKTAQITVNITPALWQRPYFWVLAGILIAVVIFIAVRRRIAAIVRREREKAKLQKTMAELEMKALRAQMNPHFIFNAIGAIQHYIVKNNTLQANEYLSKFARLMRLFLESSRNNYILLEDEINLLDLYISLEKLRFEEKFDYTMEVDADVATGKILIPSILLQPFIENAINHGLVHRETKGYLHIHFSYDENGYLVCSIDDNGIGRQQAGLLRAKNTFAHISRGGEIVEERVKAFMERDDIKIYIEITDKSDKSNMPAGTLVKVMIPLKYT